MKKGLSILLTLVLLLVLTACGGASKSTAYKVESPAAAPMEQEAVMEMAADTAAGSLNGAESGSSALPESRKWIITMDMDVETDDLDVLMEKLDAEIKALGGYVEDQNVHNGSAYASRRYRSANLTIRIPDEKAEQFTGAVSGIANVISQNMSREDITLRYVSTASRVTALETEEARLLELLAKAETMADLLEIEARLTDVRYELENHASQLRLYDNQVDYATIYLHISEVQEYTPVEDPTFLERIQTTFTDSLEGLGDGIVDITVFLVGNSPYLLTFGVILFVVLKLKKRCKKGDSKKFSFRKNKKQDEQT